MKEELLPYLENFTFPAAQIEPGKFMKDSDALVRYFVGLKGIDPADLPTLQAYKRGPFRELMKLYREYKELQKATGSGM